MGKFTCYRVFIIGVLLLWLMSSRSLWAQGNPVTAQVDRTEVGTNETFTLSVIVNGANADQPQMPTLDGLQILGLSTASQFSMVNGKTNSQLTYQYTLQPTRAGDLTIPPITVTVGGQAYNTEPIAIHVTQGAAPNQPSSGGQNASASSQTENGDLFVEGSVDSQNVYLGQQVIYHFRFYQAVNLFDQPSYDPPDFTGFWHGQKTTQGQAMTTLNGRSYQVIELQTILFPTTPGTQTIGPATLTIPGSLFQRGSLLQTEPVTVTVKPLPGPAPDGFNGAVGRITMTATVSANSVAVNEPVTLRVTLQGEGNVETWPDPVLPTLNGWRQFDSTSKTDAQINNRRLIGRRVYEQLLVPTMSGDSVLPALLYSYFDPEQGVYQTIQTQPFSITVKAGVAESPLPAVAAPTGNSGAQSPVTQIDNDIRHIKQAPTQLRPTSKPLTTNRLYWFAWGIPLLLIVGDWIWQRRRQRWANEPVLLRRTQAQKKARQALAQARKQAGDPHPVVSQVLTEYLSAKLNQPVVGLTQTMLAERLRGQGLDGALVEQVNQLLTLSEMGRFAPINNHDAGAGNLLTETEELITKLEKLL